MPHIEKSAVIACEPGAAWAFLTRRENSPLIVPHLRRVWDITPPAPGVGQTWKFEFELLGTIVQGTARTTAFEPGHSFQFETRNAIDSRWAYRVAPEETGTRVTVAVDYTLPASLKLANSPTIDGLLDAQTSAILQNLAARLRPATP